MHLQVGLFLWCTKEIKEKLEILLWPNQVTICGSLTDYKFRSIFPNMHSPDRFQSAPAYHWPLIYSEYPPTRKSQFKESFCRRQIYPDLSSSSAEQLQDVYLWLQFKQILAFPFPNRLPPTTPTQCNGGQAIITHSRAPMGSRSGSH